MLNVRRARMRNVRRFLCLLMALLASLILPGEASRAEESWTISDIRDGLLRRGVHVLAPAGDGGMWVGTSSGMNHWDGERWASFSAGNGLAPGAITAVAEQGSDVWAGSWGGGLSVLRGTGWVTYRKGDSPLPGDWISALASDGEGLWIGTYGAGLARMEGADWTTYTRANSGLPSDWLTCLLPDGRGGLWVGTERAGLARLDAGGQWHRLALPLGPAAGAHVTALALRDGQLWVGTNDGLAVMDLGAERWLAYGVERGLPHKSITALASAGEDVWIGTDGGLARWRGGKVTTYTIKEGLPQNAISAAAVDSGGRLWVGTRGRGLAVLGEMAKPQVARAPVVLVHGWRGPDSDLLEDSEFWHLARWLAEDGFTPYFAKGISPENTLHANAERLRAAIDEVRLKTGAPAVYLIGFSMGGLNSRAYLESTLYQGDVLRVFTLGSPHRGEYMWQTLLLWEYLAWRPDPSALELLPLHIDLFNKTHSKIPTAPYTLVAGDARAAGLPTLFRELPPGDGLVSTWSALGIEGGGVDKRVTEDLHAWARETILLDLPSLLYPRGTYDAHIRPYLFGAAQARGAGSPDDEAAYRSLELDPRTALRSGEVSPGQTVTVSVPIDVSGRARVLVRWKDTPVKASLRDPGGRAIKEDGAKKGDQAEYLELGFADLASYVLTDTVPGNWSLVLENESDRATAEYVAYASLVSPVRLLLRANPEWCEPGGEVTISAELTTGAGVARVEQVEAEIYGPDRTREVISLQAVQGRGEKGPLRFEGRYRAPARGGYYVAMARAAGLSGDVAFERGEQVVFGVRGDRAALSGRLTLRAEPAPGNKWRGLEATVGARVMREGEYLCSVSLLDGGGERIVALAHTARLQPGEQDLRIMIPGATIAASGREGPYRLGEVLLLDVSGAGVLLDRVMGNGEGIALRAAEFAP